MKFFHTANAGAVVSAAMAELQQSPGVKFAKTGSRTGLVCAVALTGILCAGAGVAGAAAEVGPQTAPLTVSQNSQRASRLPRAIALAVRQDVSRREGIPLDNLRIAEAEPQTWRDRCLGAPRREERCAQGLTEGWRVVVSDGSQEWTYYTDATGRNVRLVNVPDSGASLSQRVADAVKVDLSGRLRVPADAVRIVSAERRQWPNGCLGISSPGVFCTQGIVPGWEVTAEIARGRNAQQRWVYHTNESGSVVKLNQSGGFSDSGGTVKPIRIAAGELPPPLNRETIFRGNASGGFAGLSYQTVLMSDGRVIRTRVTGTGNATEIRRLSQQEVRDFQRLLQRVDWQQFDGLYYPPARGSADYTTVTLTSRAGTTRYADIIQDRLPEGLRSVVEAWNKIASR
jgi:hypothetical protein